MDIAFNSSNSPVFAVFLAILTKFSGLLPGNCIDARMPVCSQSSSTLAGFGGELWEQGLLEPSCEKNAKNPQFFCVFLGADVKLTPRQKQTI